MKDRIFIVFGVKASGGNWSTDGNVTPSSYSPDKASIFESRSFFWMPVSPIPVPIPKIRRTFLVVPGTAVRNGMRLVSKCMMLALLLSSGVIEDNSIVINI